MQLINVANAKNNPKPVRRGNRIQPEQNDAFAQIEQDISSILNVDPYQGNEEPTREDILDPFESA